ncbi:class I SAM-dependent methyltransferase [Candidatus Falkowbacteria bacterium]|nr:class I SAM-dependent methyltransferase [Candidatus Falkowbacteria bacterium]
MNNNCPVCNHEQVRLESNCQDFEYEYPGFFSLYQCPRCGLGELEPKLMTGELLRAYPKEYHGYNYARVKSKIFNTLQRLRLKKRLAFYKSLIGDNARILDIGCGDGHYMDYFAKRTNWHFVGVEFNSEIANVGISEGRSIYIGTFENADFPDDYFDLVIMDHLLEHVSSPVELLKKAKRKLKPGGYVIGELPNIASWDFILSKKYWGGLHAPRHLYDFTPASLSLTVQQAGFDNCQITYNLNTSHWALSAQNYFQSTKLFKSKLRYGRTKYYNLLLIVFIPINFIAKIFKKTGIINFIIKK